MYDGSIYIDVRCEKCNRLLQFEMRGTKIMVTPCVECKTKYAERIADKVIEKFTGKKDNFKEAAA